jgi:type VI secretion system protein ImpD
MISGYNQHQHAVTPPHATQIELYQDLAEWWEPLGLKQAATINKQTIILLMQRYIADLDECLNTQLNAIIHHPVLQKLEASWRGLAYLVEEAKQLPHIKIRALNIAWKEINNDLESAVDFDTSYLFQKIYTAEFGTAGGEPFGLLLGDYYIQHQPTADSPTDDISIISGLAKIAAAAFAPMILSIKPSLFGLTSFAELQRSINLTRTFMQLDYQRWQNLRELEDSRFIGLVMPKVLLRTPYQPDHARLDNFIFSEQTQATTDYLWGNAGFYFATIVMRNFSETGWFNAMRGIESGTVAGGVVTGLVSDYFKTDRNLQAIRYPLEVNLNTDFITSLSDLGFIPLSCCKHTPHLAFYTNSALQKSAVYDNPNATYNAKLATVLQYLLCASRFAHYLKIIIRDKIGSYTTAASLESHLQHWLTNYVMSNTDANPELDQRYPLRQAQVKLSEYPGKPGSYFAKLYIVPRIQLENLSSVIQLTTEITGLMNRR